jgi:hypothetical protein
MLQFRTYLVNIFSNINHIESNKEDSFNMCLNLVRLKNFASLYSRVGAGAGAAGAGAAGAGAASKVSPRAGAE